MTDDASSRISVDANVLRRIAWDLEIAVDALLKRFDKFIAGKVNSFSGDDKRETLRSCLVDLTNIQRRLNDLIVPPPSDTETGEH